MQPIHKFNGGLGATLCNKCHVIISNGLTQDLLCQKCIDNPDYADWKKIEHTFYYKLRLGELKDDSSVFSWLSDNYKAPKNKDQ